MADHTFQVKVQLNAEEYLAFKSVADDIGTSQSGLFRMLAKEKIRFHADYMRCESNKTTDESGKD